MRHGVDRTIALTAAWAMFGLCCIVPLVWMLVASAGEITTSLTTALTTERQRTLMGHTISLGAGAVTGALCVGIPLGVALARCHPGRVRLARFGLTVPLVVPPYVLAFLWITLTETDSAPWQYGLPAAAVTLAFWLYPVVMLATEAAMRTIPMHFEEAGQLVAPPRRVWRKIVLPLLTPAIAASALVTFVLAASDFAIPSMLRARVYTTEVFTAFSALYNFRLATVMALPLAVMGAIGGIAALTISRSGYTGRAEDGRRGARWRDDRQRIAGAILLVAGFTAVAVPPVTMALLARGSSSLFDDARSIHAIRNGVLWSITAATIIVFIGALLGSWRVKCEGVAAHMADAVWIGLFALPATVVGIGTIGVWNRAGFMGEIYRTDAIVVLAYVSRFLPLAALLSAAFLKRVPAAAEEAAVLAGASWSRTFQRIVLPLSSRGLAAIWLVAFILMFGDVSLTILVSPPGESNLPVRAYTLIANSPMADVAAVALMQIAFSVLLLGAIVLLFRARSGIS